MREHAVAGKNITFSEEHSLRRGCIDDRVGAIPAIEDGLRLTQRAFELGQSDLTRVLVVQRELADTRREQFDALVELADAGISLQRALGVLR